MTQDFHGRGSSREVVMVVKRKVPEPDTRLIELQLPNELSFWTKIFDVPQAGLLRAIAAVGQKAWDVKKYLEDQARIRRGFAPTDRGAEGPRSSIEDYSKD
jgi:uncharacterized protein DUF3606